MANLNGYILTQAGKNLFAKSSSGECKVVFTKAKIGESETTLDELLTKDDLIGTKLKLLDIVSSKAEKNKFTIITTVTNSGLEEHFYIRQLGIFAKGLSIDGLNTEILPEKLIAIAYDTNPDVIPAETNNIPYTKQMNIGFSINNADKAEIILSLTGVVTSDVLENHNNDTNAHRSLFKSLFNLTDMTLNSMKSIIQNWSKEVCLPLLGGNMKGNINASGYNITATKFIGNLQGKADSAANADLATKANQDSQGQVINTTYVKGVTASNATLTVTKGNGTTSTITINNVGNSTKATQDSQGQAINTTYIKSITASNATLTVTKGNGTTSTITINNVGNSTKATQDSQGQAINTTYIKSITASNATLTVTKGNGTTSAVTINNVAHSTDAVNAGKLNNKGDISASTLPNNFTTGLTTHSAYNGNYPSQYGNVININNKGKSQIFMGWKGDENAVGAPGGIWYRECRDNQNVWSNWAKIAYLTDCTDTLKKVYPVGSIYMSTVSTNPATLFGFGTWEAMPAGRVLLAQGKSSWGTTYNAGSTGGEATHQLTVGELPSHNHSGSTNTTGEHTHTFAVTSEENSNDSNKPTVGYNNAGTYTTSSAGNHSHTVTINNTGSNTAHNNMMPYISVYMWKRTA